MIQQDDRIFHKIKGQIIWAHNLMWSFPQFLEAAWSGHVTAVWPIKWLSFVYVYKFGEYVNLGPFNSKKNFKMNLHWETKFSNLLY
jgi:hypothetical protein